MSLMKDEGRVKTEKEMVRVALRNCGYPEWALKEGKQLGKRQKGRKEEVDEQGGKDKQEKHKQSYMVLPYIKGVGLRRGCKEPIRNRNAVVCPKTLDLARMWCSI